MVLLRTGQEALANVRKHAAARTVEVRLCYAADRVRLEVADDGAGFDPAVVNGGYGLAGMRVRVDEAGGTVAVRSAPGLRDVGSRRGPGMTADRKQDKDGNEAASPLNPSVWVAVLIADDHPVVREGLRGMLVGRAGNHSRGRGSIR